MVGKLTHDHCDVFSACDAIGARLVLVLQVVHNVVVARAELQDIRHGEELRDLREDVEVKLVLHYITVLEGDLQVIAACRAILQHGAVGDADVAALSFFKVLGIEKRIALARLGNGFDMQNSRIDSEDDRRRIGLVINHIRGLVGFEARHTALDGNRRGVIIEHFVVTVFLDVLHIGSVGVNKRGNFTVIIGGIINIFLVQEPAARDPQVVIRPQACTIDRAVRIDLAHHNCGFTAFSLDTNARVILHVKPIDCDFSRYPGGNMKALVIVCSCNIRPDC